MTRTCALPGCDTRLSTYNKESFCMPCQDAGRVPDEKDRPPLCGTCGEPFVKPFYNSLYCGDACRKEAHRRSNNKWSPKRSVRA